MKKKIKKTLSIISITIIVLVILSVVPVTVPRFIGYDVYNIVSGSMEPAIPVGSAIYVKKVNGSELKTGDVAVYYVGNSVIAHRVIENNNEALITKGDANEAEDMLAVGYGQIIGKVSKVIPMLGFLETFYTSFVGKIFAFMFLLAAALMTYVSQKIEDDVVVKKDDDDDIDELMELLRKADEEDANSNKKESNQKRKLNVVIILLLIVLAALILVIYLIVSIFLGYDREEQVYNNASASYTNIIEEGIHISECPKAVDFEELQKINSDIIGWIYCEGTVIDYPICQAADDDYYINHSYNGEQNKCGSIFLEAENKRDFSDQNSILYGHHMKNGSMFASLEEWSSQEYYEEHPVMWLITPEKNYKIIIFSEYTTSAVSDTYSIYRNNAIGLQDYIDKAISLSNIDAAAEIVVDKDSKFIVLSTCAYSFKDARTVIHGMLIED